MKIEFDKALLWLVPYLYLVSVSYYWGYWGTLDIDAFSYYAISDMVKGIISPISTTLAYLIVIVIFVLGVEFMENKLKSKPVIISLTITMLYGVFILWFIAKGMGYFVTTHKLSDALDKSNTIIIITIAWYVLSVLIARSVCLDILNISSRKEFIFYYLVSFFMISFLGRAFTTGKWEALRILQGREFNYIISDSINSSRRDVYKYLGKTGEYHILLSLDNTKRVIVPVGEIKYLSIEKMSLDDTSSIKRFKNYRKELAALVVKQPMPKLSILPLPPQQPKQPK